MPGITPFLERIADKTPTELLNPMEANNLFSSVPTPASKYIGLNSVMGKKISNDPYVRYTGMQPVQGLMNSIADGSRSPVSTKTGADTEQHLIVKFKDSLIFTDEELMVIAQANRRDANDAEMRAAQETIVQNVANLKLRNLYTQEKNFWQGCLGTMNVQQLSAGATTNYQVSTNVRSQTALSSTTLWDYYTTSITNSIADPVYDLRAMQQTFAGKGCRLGKVYMSKPTFDHMIQCPRSRDLIANTSSKLEENGFESIRMAGVDCVAYDEGYLDANGTFTKFITESYIIGVGEDSGMNSNAVDYVECLNVDAKQESTYNVETVYGTYFRIKSTDDPVNTQFLISNYALPVFKNPQKIIYQVVTS